jgi:hypothetical protein
MKHFLSALFTCSALLLSSQVAVSYFPFQSLISISSNTEKLLWADFKLETNTFFTNTNMELSPKCNIKRTERVNYYLGAGAAFNPVYSAADLPLMSGYFVEAGVRVKPLKEHKGLQVVFEISPYLNAALAGGNLRTRLGLAYNFTRKKTQ